MKPRTKRDPHNEPAGLVYDVLHDIRRAMRWLRKAEKSIMAAHRAEKRRRHRSNEWQESARIRDQERKKSSD